MWSASKEQLTLMTMHNLKRIVVYAQNASKAKHIATAMRNAADALRRKLEPRIEHLISQDKPQEDEEEITEEKRKDEEEKKKKKKIMAVKARQSASALGNSTELSSDDENSRPKFKVFQVQQTHLRDSPEMLLLRIDETGLSLMNRVTGKVVEITRWTDILMWKADSSAVTFVLTESNHQIRLATPAAIDVLDALTTQARYLLESRADAALQKPSEIDPGVAEAPLLADTLLEFRGKLLQYRPTTNEVHDQWKSKITHSERLLGFFGITSNIDLSLERLDLKPFE